AGKRSRNPAMTDLNGTDSHPKRWRADAGHRRLAVRHPFAPCRPVVWRRRVIPYPHWLSAGDNAWQLTAATLVGLMSIPALAVLYGGIVQRKWAINTMMMVFSAFALTLIVWMLWAFKMGFGSPWLGTFLGRPGPAVGAGSEQARASIPLLNGLMPRFR